MLAYLIGAPGAAELLVMGVVCGGLALVIAAILIGGAIIRRG